jgi:hypothetical protein
MLLGGTLRGAAPRRDQIKNYRLSPTVGPIPAGTQSLLGGIPNKKLVAVSDRLARGQRNKRTQQAVSLQQPFSFSVFQLFLDASFPTQYRLD